MFKYIYTFFLNNIFNIGTSDFYALNHYSSRLVTHGSDPDRNYNSDAEYVTSINESWPISVASPWLIVTI